MILKKRISIEQEIDVEICAEDLADLHLEDNAETPHQFALLVGRAHTVIAAIDPEVLPDNQRQVIADALRSEAARYDPLPATEEDAEKTRSLESRVRTLFANLPMDFVRLTRHGPHRATVACEVKPGKFEKIVSVVPEEEKLSQRQLELRHLINLSNGAGGLSRDLDSA